MMTDTRLINKTLTTIARIDRFEWCLMLGVAAWFAALVLAMAVFP